MEDIELPTPEELERIRKAFDDEPAKVTDIPDIQGPRAEGKFEIELPSPEELRAIADAFRSDPTPQEQTASESAKNATADDSARAAKAREAAERFGIPRVSAETDLDEYTQQAEREDFAKWIQNSPAFAGHLSANPADAPIYRKDAKLYANVEKALHAIADEETQHGYAEDPESSTGVAVLDEYVAEKIDKPWLASAGDLISRGSQSGWNIGVQGAAWTKKKDSGEAIDKAFTDWSKKIDAENKELAGKDTEGSLLFQGAQLIGTMVSSLYEGRQGGLMSMAMAAGAVAAGAISAPLNIPLALGAFGLGAGTYGTYAIEGGLSYKDLIENGADKQKARLIATGVGATNALIEMIGLKVAGEAAMPALRNAFPSLMSKTVSALETPTIGRLVSDGLKAVAVGNGEEILTEVMQEVVTATGEELGRAFADAKSPEQQESLVDRLLETAWQTFLGVSALQLAGGGLVLPFKLRAVHRAAGRQEQYFKTLNDAMSHAESKQLSPQATAEAVDAIAQDAGHPTVYISGYAFNQAMAESGVTIEQLREVNPELADKVQSAAESVEDVEIPMGQYAAQIAGTDLGAALEQHARTERDGISAAESRAVLDESAQIMRDVMEAANMELEEEAGETSETGAEATTATAAETPQEGAESPQGEPAEAPKASTPQDERTKALKALEDKVYEDLTASSPDTVNKPQLRAQARYAARMTMRLAEARGMKPEQAARLVPVIVGAGRSTTVERDGKTGEALMQGVRATSVDAVRAQYEGTDKWMKAPNGQPTKLTETQWLQVRTPDFKAWFGDWENDRANASKVVDENGEPLVVYHVTDSDFNTFDLSKARQSSDIPAFFFSSGTEDWAAMGSRVVQVFLNIRNPTEKPIARGDGAAAREQLIKEGYDGTIEAEDGMETEYAALYPEQIKSAVGNNGNFDPRDANIYHQTGKRNQPTATDLEFLNSQSAWLNWMPPETSTGKILGAPPEYDTNRKFAGLRNRLKKFIREGAVGRYWYEDSAEWALAMVGGDVKEAERLIQLIAIYSPQMKIGSNLLLALRAYTHWKLGRPEKDLHLKTGAQDKKARDVLWRNAEWAGRKTNTFYQNLMYAIVTRHTAECEAAGIDVKDFLSGQSTIDMWMKRAFSYDSDATTDDKGTGQYSFCEKTLRRVTAELNAELPAGAEPWTPHQVQAAIWTGVMARYEIVHDKTDLQYRKKGLAELKPVLDKKTKQPKIKKDGTPQTKWVRKEDPESKRSQMRLWYKNAMAVKTEDAKAWADENARSYATEFKRMVQQVTWEAMPSEDVPGAKALLDAPMLVRQMFTEEVARIFEDANGKSELAEKLGIPFDSDLPSFGGYKSAISPNIIARLLKVWWGDQGEPSKDAVRKFCRVIQYVCKQDAVPFFRIENRPAWIAENVFRVVDPTGKQLPRKYATQSEAEEVAKSKGDGFTVKGGNLARGFVFVFDKPVEQGKLEELLDKIDNAMGGQNGLSRISETEVLVANYRGDNGLPFAMTDENFIEAMEAISIDGLVDAQRYWIDSEYGHDHNWKADKDGEEILRLLGLENEKQGSDSGGSREAGSQHDSLSRNDLARWRSAYEKVFERYTGAELDKRKAEAAEIERQSARAEGLVLKQSAYHGTPHTVGAFSTDYIGTGEGAQAHGWGMYFSLSKDVAQWYRTALTDPYANRVFDAETGRELKLTSNGGTGNDGALFSLGRNWRNTDEAFREETLPKETVKRLAEEAIKSREKTIAQHEKAIADHIGPADFWRSRIDSLRDRIAAYREIAKNPPSLRVTKGDQGHVYKVDIPEDAEMLNEQLTMSQQPETVQRALEGIRAKFGLTDQDMTGKELYRALVEKTGSPKAASLALLDAGIKGIRYEGKQDGPCAVVFSGDAVKILEFEQRQIAYNGSPNRFNRFSTEHIGEGQGAQAHGWGLYFASSREVAEWYRRTYAKGQDGFSYEFEDGSDAHGLWGVIDTLAKKTGKESFTREEILAQLNNDREFWMRRIEQKVKNGLKDAEAAYEREKASIENERAEMNARIEELKEEIKNADAEEAENLQFELDAIYEERQAFGEQLSERLEEAAADFEQAKQEAQDTSYEESRIESIDADITRVTQGVKRTRAGQVYKAEIPGTEEMLDEDLEIAQQPKAVRQICEQIAKELGITEPLDDMMGERFYTLLEERLGSSKAASLLLNERGIKGIHYFGETDGECFVVFDDTAIEILEFLQGRQERDSADRGSYSPSDNRLTLTPNADFSTFCHEMTHFYLEQLIDIAHMPNAPASVLEDVATLFKEWGIKDLAEWDAMSFDERAKFHERFAYQSEIYLSEGKAPKLALENLFRRLGQWIRDVYRMCVGGVAGEVGRVYREQFGEDLPELSDEVRRVMDRMIASEEDVQTAENVEGLQPLFDVKPDDMADDVWDALQKERAECLSMGEEKLTEMRAKDEKWYAGARSKKLREIQKQAREARAKVREQVEEEVNQRPEMLSARLIRESGKKESGQVNLRLDSDALRAAGVPERTVLRMQSAHLTMAGGLDPATCRALLDPFVKFPSGDAMLKALTVSLDAEEIIERETTRRCLEQHSDLFNPEVVDKTVTEALHNEARARMLAHELQYLMEDPNRPARVMLRAAKQAARGVLANTKLRDASVKKFLAKEARASRKAREAYMAGDKRLAAQYKRQQLVYHECAMQVIEAEKARRAIKDLKSRVFKGDKKLSKTYDMNILAMARAILQNMGWGRGEEPVDGETYLEKVRKYDPETANGLQIFLDRYPYRGAVDPEQMTVADLIDLKEDVQAIVRLARSAREFVAGETRTTVEEAVAELVDQFDEHNPETYEPGLRRKISTHEKRQAIIFSAKAWLRRVESWCLAMDNGSVRGPFNRYIFRPIADAAARYRTRNAELQEKLAKIFERMQSNWGATGEIESPELNYTFSRKSELIGAILHTGNASNLEKLLVGGRGENAPWGALVEGADGSRQLDDRRWQVFIHRCYAEGIVTKEDMDAVQEIWDLLEDLKVDSQKAYYAYYGMYFDEIEAQEIVTPFGTYRGGYAPAATDPDLVAGRSKQLEQDAFADSNIALDLVPITQPGFTKSRVQNYHKPLLLDLSLVSSHIQREVRFAVMAQPVKSVQRLLRNHDLADHLNRFDPKLISEMLMPWLKRSAEQTVTTPSNDFGRAVSYLRNISSMAIMVGNVINALQQYTGWSIAASKVPARKLMRAIYEAAANPSKSVETVMQASPFMRARLHDFQFEFQTRIRKIAAAEPPTTTEQIREWVSTHGYFLQTFVQRQVDVPVWMAAYNDALARGMDQDDAVAHADMVVRTTQSAFDPESVSRVETGDPLQRMLLVFYNYFDMQLNALGKKWALRKEAKQYGKFLVDATLILAVPAVLSEAIADWARGSEDDDEDDWWIEAFRFTTSSIFKNLTAMLPWAGNGINIALGQLARSDAPGSGAATFLVGKNPYNAKTFSVPALQFPFDAAHAPIALWRYLEDDGSARKATVEMLNLTSLLTGIPVAGVKRPAGYLAGVASGEIQPEDPIDVVKGILSGRGPSK